MKMKFFYEVPVYRLTEEKYNANLQNYIDTKLAGKDKFYSDYPREQITHQEYAIKNYGGLWRYNEIIGFIHLYFLGSQVRGEYYANDAKRCVKTRKKQLKWVTHKLAPEVELPVNESSIKIFHLILSYLFNCKKELKGRYVDTSSFETVGPFVDWKLMLSSKD